MSKPGGVSGRWVAVSSAAAVLVGVLATAGCGGREQTGQMIVSYGEATTPTAVRGRTLMQNARLLEDLAIDVNDSLELPYDVTLAGVQCGEANAYWSSGDRKITICYEDAEMSLRLFEADPNYAEDPAHAAINATIATFFHEVGHAVISVYQLPVTGREEDVADQLAAFAILEPDDVLKDKAFLDPAKAVEDFAVMFKLYAAARGGVDQSDFAAVHSLNETRMYNLKCWIYGSDPTAHAAMVTDGLLPADRAARCPNEYRQLVSAWTRLLAPHLK